jgi:hypothetical protein
MNFPGNREPGSESQCFLKSILWYSQSGDHPHEDLLKFGNNQDMKVKLISTSFDIFGYLLEPCTEEIWRFFFIYFKINKFWRLEYPKNHFIFACFILNFVFWRNFGADVMGISLSIGLGFKSSYYGFIAPI